ncbi:MAG: hypothetical protein R3F29_02590 [Planctomycetota bacterium]
MNVPAAALLGCVFGVAVTGAVAFAALRDGPPGAPVPVGGGGVEPPASAPVASLVDVDQSLVLARLDALAAQLERLQQTVAELPAGGGARVPVATTTTTAIVDADSLQAAMHELERRRLEALSDEDLRNEARVAAKSGQVGEAIEICERLLARAETPEQRAAALRELAIMQRAQKSPDGIVEAQRTLQSIVDEFGNTSDAGREAVYQLIWTVPKDDPQRGLAYAQAYVADPGLSPQQRVQGRWALAIQQHAVGDTAVARAGFEQLLGEISDQPNYGKLVEDIRQRLASWK